LVTLELDQLQGKIPSYFTLLMEDGEKLNTTFAEAFLTTPWLRVLREYPKVVITKKLYIHEYLQNNLISIGDIIKLASAIRKAIILTYNITDPNDIVELNDKVAACRNVFYNSIIYLEPYMSGGCLEDFIEIHNNKRIKKNLSQRLQYTEWVEQTHNIIMDELIKADSISLDNEIRKAILARNVNTTQALQCVGPRGVLADIDGTIYPTIITRGYSEGLENIVFMALDSRMAAKALFLADDMIRKAEYFARRLQVVAIGIERAEGDDCGTNNYLEWDVEGMLYEDGSVKSWGTLPYLIGSYYLDDSGELKRIEGNEKHLIGKTIRKRWVVGCKNKNPHTKCRKCLGDIVYNVPPQANIGHLAAAVMTEQTTQRVLSAKHKMGSTIETNPFITDVAKRYFQFEDEAYWIKDNTYTHIGINIQQLRNLSMKSIIGSVEIGNIDTVSLYKDNDLENPKRVRIINTKGGLILSKDFIKYINNITINNNGKEYIFTLEKWKFTKPIFRLIPKEYGYQEHLADIESVLFSLSKNNSYRSNKILDRDPREGLLDFYHKINPDLQMNISFLEVIICALCARNPTVGDYRLPIGNPEAKMVKILEISRNRSKALLYTYEKMTDPIYSPEGIGCKVKDDHIYDVLIKPHDVYKSLTS